MTSSGFETNLHDHHFSVRPRIRFLLTDNVDDLLTLVVEPSRSALCSDQCIHEFGKPKRGKQAVNREILETPVTIMTSRLLSRWLYSVEAADPVGRL